MINRATKNPLHGLPQAAIELIYNEQPLHRAVPTEDPLVILNQLDNTEKHDDLSPAFVYSDVGRGVDLIEVLDRRRVKRQENLWTAGTDLEDGTLLARYLIDGDVRRVLQADNDAALGFATGKVGAARVGYVALIDRVRDIATNAERLLDSQP